MGYRGRDRMVVGFITTYYISAYHHWRCEFDSCSLRGVFYTALCYNVCYDKNILDDIHNSLDFHSTFKKSLTTRSDLRQFSGFLRVLRFPPLIILTATT
jgi:hypothetical protein